MKFKIISKKESGEHIVHYFDNLSLDITTEDGIPVALDKDPRCKTLMEFNYKYVPVRGLIKKRDEITVLRLTLGFNCNFHCKYCSEHLSRDAENKKKQITIHQDVTSRATAVAERIVKNFPRLGKLVFWGGEPFVYLKAMKVIVAYFKEHAPKVQIQTITNGSLLTLDVAKWIAENDIILTISHDGHSFNTYRDDKDPLDIPKSREAIQYLIEHRKNKVTFNGVITPENADLQKIPEYFKERLGEDIPNMSFECLAKLDRMTEKIITPFDVDSTKVVLNNMVAYGSTQDANHVFGPFRDRVSDLMARIVQRITLPDVHCMVGSDFFTACDMDGNILICHGVPIPYCTIETLDQVKFPDTTKTWKDRISVTHCDECPLLVACGGGCPLAEDEDHKVTCKNLKIWASGLFIAAWKLLFNATICRIEPITEEKVK